MLGAIYLKSKQGNRCFFFSYCTCSGRAALHVSEQIHVLSLEKESVQMFGGIGHAPVH